MSYAKVGANTLSVSTAAANKYTADTAQYKYFRMTPLEAVGVRESILTQ